MTKTIRALFIDAAHFQVRAVEVPADAVEQARAIHEMLGGYLEIARAFPNGDLLFVDEDGLQHDPPYGFSVLRQAFVGNGVVVGAADGKGDCQSVATSLDTLDSIVMFSRRL